MVVYPSGCWRTCGGRAASCSQGSVLLELARRGVSREQAYEWVQRNAMRSFHEQVDFKQLLLDDADVMRVAGREVIDEAFDLGAQLKHAETIFGRVFMPAAARSST